MRFKQRQTISLITHLYKDFTIYYYTSTNSKTKEEDGPLYLLDKNLRERHSTTDIYWWPVSYRHFTMYVESDRHTNVKVDVRPKTTGSSGLSRTQLS